MKSIKCSKWAKVKLYNSSTSPFLYGPIYFPWKSIAVSSFSLDWIHILAQNSTTSRNNGKCRILRRLQYLNHCSTFHQATWGTCLSISSSLETRMDSRQINFSWTHASTWALEQCLLTFAQKDVMMRYELNLSYSKKKEPASIPENWVNDLICSLDEIIKSHLLYL